MHEHDRDKWNARYRATGAGAPPSAARVLAENTHLLPAHGKALDLACGLGGNALLLARHGLHTTAWDLSEEALSQAAGFAERAGHALTLVQRDVVARPPRPASFDVIVVSRFLERAVVPALIAALRPDGLLFYQTFTREAVTAKGPRRPAYRLAPNELLRLFAELHVLVYREEGRVGDTTQGWRDEALLVAQARSPGLAAPARPA